MTTLSDAARAVVEGLDHSDFWRADPRTLALRAAILAAEQAPAVVTAEDVADLLESGYDSAEGPTRRWCEEMGRAIVALVAGRTAPAVGQARLDEREACASEGAQVVPLPGFRCAGCGRVAPDDPRADLAARYRCPDCAAKEAPPAPERLAGTVRVVPAEEERDFLRAQVTRLRAREARVQALVEAAGNVLEYDDIVAREDSANGGILPTRIRHALRAALEDKS